jgi:hypothetical protein
MLGFQALGRLALGQIGAPPGIAANVGGFTLTGNAVGLSASIGGGTGAFVLSGQDATLVYVSGSVLDADPGEFALTGIDASFGVGMPAETGAFVVSGQAAALPLTMPAAKGTFAWSGPATILARDLILYATPTAVIRGTNHFLFAPLGGIALGESTTDEELADTFSLTGRDITLYRAALVSMETGEFVWTGINTTFISSAYPQKLRVFPSVGRGARSTSRGNQPIRVFSSTGHGARRRAFGG